MFEDCIIKSHYIKDFYNGNTLLLSGKKQHNCNEDPFLHRTYKMPTWPFYNSLNLRGWIISSPVPAS